MDKILENIDIVDLLKIDCEGAEYEILFNALSDSYAKIKLIRMEFHCGQIFELSSFLEGFGFRQTKLNYDSEDSGALWFEKSENLTLGSSDRIRKLTANS